MLSGGARQLNEGKDCGLRPGTTISNGIYVRKYEPELSWILKGKDFYLNEHLKPTLYKDQNYNSLLR